MNRFLEAVLNFLFDDLRWILDAVLIAVFRRNSNSLLVGSRWISNWLHIRDSSRICWWARWRKRLPQNNVEAASLCVGTHGVCYGAAYGPHCSTAITSHRIKNDKMLKTTEFNAMLLNLLIPVALSAASSGTSAIRLTALVKTNADIIPIAKEIIIQSHSWFMMHCF